MSATIVKKNIGENDSAMPTPIHIKSTPGCRKGQDEKTSCACLQYSQSPPSPSTEQFFETFQNQSWHSWVSEATSSSHALSIIERSLDEIVRTSRKPMGFTCAIGGQSVRFRFSIIKQRCAMSRAETGKPGRRHLVRYRHRQKSGLFDLVCFILFYFCFWVSSPLGRFRTVTPVETVSRFRPRSVVFPILSFRSPCAPCAPATPSMPLRY